MASLVTLRAEDKTGTDIETSATILTIIGLAAIIFVYILVLNHRQLKDDSVESKIGTLY